MKQIHLVQGRTQANLIHVDIVCKATFPPASWCNGLYGLYILNLLPFLQLLNLEFQFCGVENIERMRRCKRGIDDLPSALTVSLLRSGKEGNAEKSKKLVVSH